MFVLKWSSIYLIITNANRILLFVVCWFWPNFLGSDWIDPNDPTHIAETQLLTAANQIEAAAKRLSALKPRIQPVRITFDSFVFLVNIQICWKFEWVPDFTVYELFGWIGVHKQFGHFHACDLMNWEQWSSQISVTNNQFFPSSQNHSPLPGLRPPVNHHGLTPPTCQSSSDSAPCGQWLSDMFDIFGGVYELLTRSQTCHVDTGKVVIKLTHHQTPANLQTFNTNQVFWSQVRCQEYDARKLY